MNVGDLVRLKNGLDADLDGKEGIIVDKLIEERSLGERILVYKLLIDGIIISVPLKWMILINTHPETQEK
tara:strand:- start:16 stop:225 length:210 start_codon:yes stop_codon:yes gene_type:complete